MNGIDELESLLDDSDFADFEERSPRRNMRSQVRTPSRRSSFQPRQTTTPASQTQVHAAARNLDSKIETLTTAVKALETRANSAATEQDRTTVALRKEITDRKKTADTIRGDLQQTKMLSVILPMVTQDTVPATNTATGQPVQVVAQSQNQFASILPLLLLMGGSSGDSAKGPLGDQMTTLMFVLLLSKK
jgi:hypothetical protein